MIILCMLMAAIWLIDDELAIRADIELYFDDIERTQCSDMAFLAATGW